jgi:hypothetical protein
MQQCVTLSVTEAKLVSATTCTQDMICVMSLLESVGLKVKNPMVLEVNNEGAKDLTENRSVGGRTQHEDLREYFLLNIRVLMGGCCKSEFGY